MQGCGTNCWFLKYIGEFDAKQKLHTVTVFWTFGCTMNAVSETFSIYSYEKIIWKIFISTTQKKQYFI